MVTISLPLVAAAFVFLFTLWIIYLSPISGLVRTTLDILTDPLVSLVSAAVAAGVALYVLQMI